MNSGLTVAQMSRATGVTGHTLRYWENAGLILPIGRTMSGQRRYQAKDVAWVEFLLRLKSSGMSIAHMCEYAQLRAQGEATIPARIILLRDQQKLVAATITVLQDQLNAFEEKIGSYQAELGEKKES